MRKDSQAVLDYSVDWTEWLDGDTIATSSWTVAGDADLTITASSFSGGVATVWLSGGSTGKSYRVTNKITTAQGRTDRRSITITVEDR
jgi:hypothetical protein